MLALTFGAIEFGLAYNQKGNMEAATRSGARIGATLFSVTENANNQQLAEDVLGPVNAALQNGSTPSLDTLYVYKAGVGINPRVDCSLNCVSFPVDPNNHSQFLDAPSGSWPQANRTGCGQNPDKITVQIDAHHDVLTGLIPGLGNTINLTSTSTLQFEPNNC